MASPRKPTILFLAGIGMTLDNFLTPVAAALGGSGYRRIAVAGRGSIPPRMYAYFDQVYEIAPFRRAGGTGFLRAAVQLRRIVRTERPDLLHLHSPYGVALGRFVARATGTPHVGVVRGTLFDSRTAAGRLFAAVEIATARLTPTYVTLNPDDGAMYRRIAPRSAVYLAPCGGAGVDPSRVRPRGARPADPARPRRMLVMGRLTVDKNFDLAVAAWRLARESVPDLELRVVGSTAPGEPAWTPPDEPGISVRSWTSQPSEEFAAADVIVSTSPREGMPMTLVEALTAGVPVVAVDNRGTRALADQVSEGMTLVPDQVSAVASAVLAQLRAGTVRVPADVLKSWSQDAVVSFHVDRIRDAVGEAAVDG